MPTLVSLVPEITPAMLKSPLPPMVELVTRLTATVLGSETAVALLLINTPWPL